jgi:hypothetical protein
LIKMPTAATRVRRKAGGGRATRSLAKSRPMLLVVRTQGMASGNRVSRRVRQQLPQTFPLDHLRFLSRPPSCCSQGILVSARFRQGRGAHRKGSPG